MKKRFYITTPIYYVNDIPHIGHAYTTIAADILARFNRLQGKEVFFLTGTDEHGQKVEKAAAEKKRTPKEHADIMMDNFRNLWKRLNISNDAFIRTTDDVHIKTVQGLLQILWDRGEIEKREYSGWYCTPDERFWTEKDLVEDNCPDCGRPVDQIHEENYFFLMSKYQNDLINYIADYNPNYILPETRKNEVLGFLRNNVLGDLCISRPKQRLSWGIPLPFDENFITYVWFDALVNYFSATKYLFPSPDAQLSTLNSDDWWPATHHLIGKDILTTHAVYWSTMLMALNKIDKLKNPNSTKFSLPENIFAHGWWTVHGKKMSKSLGNMVDPNAIVEKYGVDALRYFLFREVPFGLDGDFSEQALINRINTDLANDLGNLLSRTLTMIEKYRSGEIPSETNKVSVCETGPVKVNPKYDFVFLGSAYKDFLSALNFYAALSEVWETINSANKYIEVSAPWKEKDEAVLSHILYNLAESLRIIAIYIYPFMPSTANEIWRQLGIGTGLEETVKLNPQAFDFGGVELDGRKIQKAEHLFPRIETKEAKNKSREAQNPSDTPMP